MDNLEQFIKEQKGAFDTEKMPAGHRESIHAKLRKRNVRRNLCRLAVAAVFILIVGAGAVLTPRFLPQGAQGGYKMCMQPEYQHLPGDYAAPIAYYQNRLDTQDRKVFSLIPTSAISDQKAYLNQV